MKPAGARAGAERPGVAYYLTFATALVGLVLIAVAVEGTNLAATGGDGLDALSGTGVPALIVAWAAAFYARLAFSDRLAPGTRSLVHASLRVLVAAEIVAAVWATWFVLGTPASPAELRGAAVLADALQIGSALWVLRFWRDRITP